MDVHDWFIDPGLYTVLAIGAFLSTGLMMAVGLIWDWATEAHGSWSLGWAYLTGYGLGCMAGTAFLIWNGPIVGDPNPFSLPVFWFLGIALLMLPITATFIVAFIGVFGMFILLIGLLGMSMMFWWAMVPIGIALVIGLSAVSAISQALANAKGRLA